jgi:hypothetical protein
MQEEYDRLYDSIGKGVPETVKDIVHYFNKYGKELLKVFSADRLQELHDKAGQVLFGYSPTCERTYELMKMETTFPSTKEFFDCLGFLNDL